MKYVVITSLYRPYVRGGAEVIADDIIHTLSKEHEVYVITTSPWKGWHSLIPRMTREDGVYVIRFYPLNIFSFISIGSHAIVLRCVWHLIDLFNIHSFFVIRSLLRHIRPDCVFTHNIKGLGYMVPLAIRQSRSIHVHTLHDVQLVIPSGLLYLGHEQEEYSLANRFHAGVSKFFFGSPDWVIYPSHFLKEFYSSRNFFPYSLSKILRNPLGPQKSAEVRVRTLHGDGTVHFFVAGALNEAKGILFLCRVFQALPDSHSRLWIAGAGPDESAILDICKHDSRITLLGRLTHDELLRELSRMHYAIIPSLCYENAPTILTESLSHGIPVIVADIGGAAEGVEDGVNGFVFKSGDADSLSRTLSRALRNGEYELFCRRATDVCKGRSSEEYVRNITQLQKR